MYTVRTDDPLRSPLTSSLGLPGALARVEALAQAARDQLHAGAEGHRDFWLRLVVTDPAGREVAWSATTGRPGHPPPLT